MQQIEAVGDRHGVPLRAAALQFPLHHPLVASVIPGVLRPQQVEDNLAMLRYEIPAAFWAELKAAGHRRLCVPPSAADLPGPGHRRGNS